MYARNAASFCARAVACGAASGAVPSALGPPPATYVPRPGARFEIAFGDELFERQRDGVSPEPEPLRELPRPKEARPEGERPRFDRLTQPPRELDDEMLAGCAIGEKRLEIKWLLHIGLKWHVTESHSCRRVRPCSNEPPSFSCSRSRWRRRHRPPRRPHRGSHDFDWNFGTWKTHIKRLVHPLSGRDELGRLRRYRYGAPALGRRRQHRNGRRRRSEPYPAARHSHVRPEIASVDRERSRPRKRLARRARIRNVSQWSRHLLRSRVVQQRDDPRAPNFFRHHGELVRVRTSVFNRRRADVGAELPREPRTHEFERCSGESGRRGRRRARLRFQRRHVAHAHSLSARIDGEAGLGAADGDRHGDQAVER